MQQNYRMLHQMSGLPVQSPLRTISVLVVHLLLAHFCRGQSQLIGLPQPIVATVGDDIILPCHLEPAVDVAAKTLEWTRPDLNPRFVYVWRAAQDLVNVKNPSYKGRTSLFIDELKHGNISMKLSKVEPSDEGRYKCYIPEMNIDSFVELVVGAVSSPVIDLAGIDRDKGGLMLDCKSKGWYPEPEVFWLDGEGNLLSAGPTETVRGPDDLYTVSSRVTVEKRHSNSFTCRVQQKNINQTRETEIHVPDDFFSVQCSSSLITIGLAVSLAACIVFILLLVFSVWKWSQNIKTKRSHQDETDKGERKNCSKSNKTEDQLVTEEEREREQLMTDETVQMEVLNMGEGEKKTKHLEDKEQAADTKWRETNEELKKANLQLENKNAEISQLNKQVNSLSAEVKTLKAEKQSSEVERQWLQKELETTKKEMERIKGSWFPWLKKANLANSQRKSQEQDDTSSASQRP